MYLLGGAHVSAWKLIDNRTAITGTLDVNKYKFVPGANIGAGMQFELNPRTMFFAEVKYVIASAGQLVFTPGLLYAF